MEDFLLKLKESSSADVGKLLDTVVVTDGRFRITSPMAQTSQPSPKSPAVPIVDGANAQISRGKEDKGHAALNRNTQHYTPTTDSDTHVDVSSFLSFDELGRAHAFGPASSLHKANPPIIRERPPKENIKHQLIANAALQRQQEYEINLMPDIDGVDTELATHLLDLHWNRQHHTFLLTYRPAFTRDLICGGPYASKFLVNAIFACASKYSDRPELRANASLCQKAGDRFFRRCAELLAEDHLFARSEIPTVAGLLLLGSTFLALGEVSQGWLYSGIAFRMIFDLGLHIEHAQSSYDEETLEIRRRLFWGAFICDKLQSLYVGRPASIDLCHCSVSKDFLDSYEERELWSPYVDFKDSQTSHLRWLPTPIHSVSAFTQLCALAELMKRVFDCIYVMDPHKSITKSKLSIIDEGLQGWQSNLPASLQMKPWREGVGVIERQATPNTMNLNAMYYALVILRHRPFLSDGHLRSWNLPADSWKQCTEAASSISGIITAYRTSYSLRRGPYMLSYAAYVACTIHVRNAALEHEPGAASVLLNTTLSALEELTVPNPGVAVPLNIIKDLMKRHGVNSSIGQ